MEDPPPPARPLMTLYKIKNDKQINRNEVLIALSLLCWQSLCSAQKKEVQNDEVLIDRCDQGLLFLWDLWPPCRPSLSVAAPAVAAGGLATGWWTRSGMCFRAQKHRCQRQIHANIEIVYKLCSFVLSVKLFGGRETSSKSVYLYICVLKD